jgi:hypothetical protein
MTQRAILLRLLAAFAALGAGVAAVVIVAVLIHDTIG